MKHKPYTYAEKQSLTETQRAARLIARCFNGVEWNYQCFFCGGVQMKTESGETKFYESSPIDAAIRKMNRVVRWMTRHGMKPEQGA